MQIHVERFRFKNEQVAALCKREKMNLTNKMFG